MAVQVDRIEFYHDATLVAAIAVDNEKQQLQAYTKGVYSNTENIPHSIMLPPFSETLPWTLRFTIRNSSQNRHARLFFFNIDRQASDDIDESELTKLQHMSVKELESQASASIAFDHFESDELQFNWTYKSYSLSSKNLTDNNFNFGVIILKEADDRVSEIFRFRYQFHDQSVSNPKNIHLPIQMAPGEPAILSPRSSSLRQMESEANDLFSSTIVLADSRPVSPTIGKLMPMSFTSRQAQLDTSLLTDFLSNPSTPAIERNSPTSIPDDNADDAAEQSQYNSPYGTTSPVLHNLARLTMKQAPEDSPLFRATLLDYEKKTAAFKQQLKKIVKCGEAMIVAINSLNAADESFTEAMSEFSALQESTSLLKSTRQAILTSRQHFLHQFESVVLLPLQMLYLNDVKGADRRKQEFDDASDDFYHYAQKYLSNKGPVFSPSNSSNAPLHDDRKAARFREKDAKYNKKKSLFDLQRYTYITFLQELHGRKTAELKNYFLTFAEKENRYYEETSKKLKALHPQLVNLDRIMKTDGSKASLEVREQEELKKVLKDVVSAAESEVQSAKDNRSVADSNRSRSISHAYATTPTTPASKVKGYRDLDSSLRFQGGEQFATSKEGFLYTTKQSDAVGSAMTNMSNNGGTSSVWSRTWCVLATGVLHEYSEWEKKLAPSFSFNLRTCTVREVVSTGSNARKFCFEIISPACIKAYQAMSLDECHNWIKSIAAAIESALHDIEDAPPESRKNSVKQTSALYSVSGNQNCADCNIPMPDWCSLNLGVLICMECSAAHRSVGTHISKVRSLHLDQSWIEYLDVLVQLGNERVNDTFEARLESSNEKLSKESTPNERAAYVTAKYFDLRYCNDGLLLPDGQRFVAEFGSQDNNQLARFCDADTTRWIKNILGSTDCALSLLQCFTELNLIAHEMSFDSKDARNAITDFFSNHTSVMSPLAKKFLELNGYLK